MLVMSLIWPAVLTVFVGTLAVPAASAADEQVPVAAPVWSFRRVRPWRKFSARMFSRSRWLSQAGFEPGGRWLRLYLGGPPAHDPRRPHSCGINPQSARAIPYAVMLVGLWNGGDEQVKLIAEALHCHGVAPKNGFPPAGLEQEQTDETEGK